MKIKRLAKEYFLKKDFLSSFLIVLGYMLKVVLVIAIPLMTKYILDSVLPAKDYVLLTKWALAITFTSIGLIAIGFLNTYLANRLKYGFENYLKTILLERVIHSRWSELAQKGVGYLTKRIEGDISGINVFLIDNILDLARDAVTLIVSIIVVSRFNLKLSLVFSCVLPVFAISLRIFNKGMKQRTTKLQEKKANNSSYLNEVISGRLEIKYLGIENEIINRYLQKLRTFFRIAIDRFLYSCRPSTLGQLSSTFGKVILIWFGGYLIIKGELTFGVFFAFNMLMTYVFRSVSGLANLNISIQTGLSCIKRVEEMLSIEQEKKEGVDIEGIRNMEFSHVYFSYPDAKDGFELQNVSFDLKKGEIITLAGESGSGKSTVFKLLQRVYLASKGEITVNGIDINSISIDSYRQKVAIVQQDPFLFLTTIRDNISMGKLDATDDEIKGVIRKSQAIDFVEHLEKGLDHKLYERGENISGGQKQRLAIARAFLKNPDVLLLDEATSGLDAKNIKALHNILIDGKDDKITVVIGHSREAMLLADKIVLLHKGRFITVDTHKNLLKSNSIYQHLFQEIGKERIV
jgi:ABC-type bacteriocin/lantibiotic exporter with double-glycine peptidase domain